MSRKLSEPILDGDSVRSNFFSNFFNGRLLTADALSADQLANREQRRLLGRAVGEGVVEGLEVSVVSAGGAGSQPVVSVTKGLALSRAGQVLRLLSDEQVALVRQLDAPPAAAGAFADCAGAVSTFDTLENGAYLLVIGAASGYRERVPMRGISDAAGVNECGSRYRVEGVQFRLARLRPEEMSVLPQPTRQQLSALMSSTAAADLSKLRNLLAHVCFGTEELAALPREPFKQTGGESAYASYGAADFMRGKGLLNDCEVPLALVYWRGGTLRFADAWAVRRRVRARTSGPFAQLFPPRRVAESEAMLFQFEEHLRALLAAGPNPENFVAANLFRWLPPAGLVPLRSNAHPAGATFEKFFQGRSFGAPTLLPGAKLGAALADSLDYPPVDLAGQELVQLYEVKENKQAQSGGSPPQPYVVYASQELPYYSEQPRFAALCQTLRETRQTYRDFVLKNVFLGNVTSPQGLSARLAVTAALQAVWNAAGERFVAACRCNCVLTTDKALSVMQDLYDAQKTLASVMKADRGDISVEGMPDYVKQLAALLDVATPGQKPSFKAALEAKDLKAALNAQNVINGLGATWSGEVVTGNLEVTYQSAERGPTLEIGDTTPFNYTFRVWNKTNRALDIELRAAFQPPRAAWNAGVTVKNFPGDPGTVSLQPYNQSNPNNPAAFADVIVSVTTPTGASAGDKGLLRLTASVPSPVGVADFDEKELAVGETATTEPATTVDFISAPDIDGNPAAAVAGDDLPYTFHTRFHTTTGATTREFRFMVVYVSPPNASSLYTVTFGNKTAETDASLSNTAQKATKPYPMTNDVDDSVIVNVRPAGGALGHPLTFKVRIQSVQDSTLSKESENFTVNAVSD
ncbi:MAG TPA: hypothetical protein VF736_21070 [Pyrinomonadaceae bacterium]